MKPVKLKLSTRIKIFMEELRSKSKDIEFYIEYYYNEVLGKLYYNPLRRIKNFFYFGYKMNDTFPWDFTTLYVAIDSALGIILKSHERAIESGWAYVGSEKEMKRMKLCMVLIKRIIEDDYYTKYNDTVNNCYSNDGCLYEMMSEKYFEGRKEVTDKEYSRALNNSFEMQKQLLDIDIELLFKILKKHSRKWWN